MCHSPSSCSNQTPQIEWLINNSNLILIAWRSKVWDQRVSWGSSSGLQTSGHILTGWKVLGSSVGSLQFSSVHSLSRVWFFATPYITARQASLSITNSQSLLKHMSIESVMPSSHLILCCPPLSSCPNPSQHQSLFQWVNSSHEVAKVLEFQLQHQSFQWTPSTDLL